MTQNEIMNQMMEMMKSMMMQMMNAPKEDSAAPTAEPIQAPSPEPVHEVHLCEYSTLNGATYNIAVFGEKDAMKPIIPTLKSIIGGRNPGGHCKKLASLKALLWGGWSIGSTWKRRR